jgi:hypothetical protein
MELGPRATRHALLLALTLLAGCGEEEQRTDDTLLTAAAPTQGQGPRLAGQAPGSAAESRAKPALATPPDSAPDDADMDFSEVTGQVVEPIDRPPPAPPTPPPEPAAEAPEERSLPAFSRVSYRAYRQRHKVLRHAEDGGDYVPQDDPVLRALTWLAAHQHPDGHWGAADAPAWCEGEIPRATPPSHPGPSQHDVAVTALALSCFLGAGWTDHRESPFRRTILRARVWLESKMDARGTIATWRQGAWLWGHALATLALVQGTDLTLTEAWRRSAERALGGLAHHRAAGTGGVWSYGLTSGAADLTLTLWAALPLLAARQQAADWAKRGKAPLLQVDEEALAAARAVWRSQAIQLRDASADGWARDWHPDLPGTATSLRSHVAALRLLDGENPREVPDLAADIAAIAAARATWDPTLGEVDPIAWWLGTLATFGAGFTPWKSWEGWAAERLLPLQAAGPDPCTDAGSWAPAGRVGQTLGRAGTTAWLCFVAQVLYRYDRAIGTR